MFNLIHPKVRVKAALAADFIDKNIKSTHARSALKKAMKSHDMAWLVSNIQVEEVDGGLHQAMIILEPRSSVNGDDAFQISDMQAILDGMNALTSNPKLSEVAFVPAKRFICFQYQPEKSARSQPADKSPEVKEDAKPV